MRIWLVMDSYNLDLTRPVPKSRGDSAHRQSSGVTSPTVPYMFFKIKKCCCQKHVLFGPLVHIAISLSLSLSLSLSHVSHGFIKHLTNLNQCSIFDIYTSYNYKKEWSKVLIRWFEPGTLWITWSREPLIRPITWSWSIESYRCKNFPGHITKYTCLNWWSNFL